MEALSQKSEIYCLDFFSSYVGESFFLHRGGGWISVILAEATASSGHQAGVAEKFSLIFTAGAEKPLQQGTHEIKHEALGSFELFITPIMAPRGSGDLRYYQAIINREVGL